MCLAAQEIEASGIPTLVLGAALDIMQAGRPPRGVFVDYPLGHSSGKPDDPADQYAVLRAAVNAFVAIGEPGRILRLPNRWDAGEAWKQAAASASGGDTRQSRDESPRYQFEADKLAAESGAR